MKAIYIILIFIFGGFCNDIFAGDLDLTSPSYISDGGSPPTWYVPVLRNSTATFTASPSETLSSLSWSFTNATPGTGSGNGPIVVTYDQAAAEGTTNQVTFTSIRTDGSGATCTTTNKPLLEVVLIDIQYQTSPGGWFTSATYSTNPSDAIVRLHNLNYPTETFNLPCQIRISAANVLPNDLTVCLSNGSGSVGQLGFSQSGDATSGTLALTLPKSGAWVNFNISGQTKSSSIGDASIAVNENSASGPLLGQTPMTVYDFESNVMNFAAGSYYSLHTSAGNAFYDTGFGVAVQWTSSSKIHPDGVSLAASQLANIVMGLTQNDMGDKDALVYSNPTIAWTPIAPTGKTVSVASEVSFGAAITSPEQDCVNGSSDNPLYSSTDTATPNGSPISDNDTPSIGPKPTTYTQGVYNEFDDLIAVVTYTVSGAGIQSNFQDWLETYNTSSQEIIPVAQNGWTQNDLSTNPSATVVPGTMGSVSSMPVTGSPYANNAPAGYVPTGTTTFTKGTCLRSHSFSSQS